MNLYYFPELTPEAVSAAPLVRLVGDEAKHAVKVMRMKNGHKVYLTDGKGNRYESVMVNDLLGNVELKVLSCESAALSHNPALFLAVAPTKNPDRMEWLVEKATEIGLASFQLIECEHSERTRLNVERLKRIAVAAMKQSLRFQLPIVADVISFKQLVSMPFEGAKYIAWCDTSTEVQFFELLPLASNCLILIGPEGDFSPTEIAMAIENGFVPVSLGSTRFRTETAALSAAFMFNLKNSLL
jgi:16S rRNA (uracil1498-N3)-methyltransferase